MNNAQRTFSGKIELVIVYRKVITNIATVLITIYFMIAVFFLQITETSFLHSIKNDVMLEVAFLESVKEV